MKRALSCVRFHLLTTSFTPIIESLVKMGAPKSIINLKFHAPKLYLISIIVKTALLKASYSGRLAPDF